MRTSTGWPPEVEELLTRARTLTPDEIRAIALGYADAAFGDPRERRSIVHLAVRRAEASGAWRELQDEASIAIRHSAATRSPALARLTFLFDAELAAADAAIVALLPERFSEELASRIAGPWRRVACG